MPSHATFFGSVGVTFWAIRTIVATVLSEKWMWIWPVMLVMPLIFSDACLKKYVTHRRSERDQIINDTGCR